MHGLNDTKVTKKEQVTLILYSFTPSKMKFQAILMPEVILAKNFVTKNILTWTIPILSML